MNNNRNRVTFVAKTTKGMALTRMLKQLQSSAVKDDKQ